MHEHAAALLLSLAAASPSSSGVRADPVRIDKLDVDDGLSQNFIRDIIQDHHGYLRTHLADVGQSPSGAIAVRTRRSQWWRVGNGSARRTRKFFTPPEGVAHAHGAASDCRSGASPPDAPNPRWPRTWCGMITYMAYLARSSSGSRAADPVPPLENGDRLTRAEFERRYRAMPHVHKAELIEGVVYMPSPVRLRRHSGPHLRAATWLGTYAGETSGLEAGDNGTVRLDGDNELQPDLMLLIDPERGGQARISDDDYVEGAPELAFEIASSSASYDLNAKLDAYRRNGVREYVVWRVLDEQIDWFVQRDGAFVRLEPDASGVYRSEVFPGLWLDSKAMLRGDSPEALRTLRRGLDTAEHADFVARLAPAS